LTCLDGHIEKKNGTGNDPADWKESVEHSVKRGRNGQGNRHGISQKSDPESHQQAGESCPVCFHAEDPEQAEKRQERKGSYQGGET
jgi:hypothetical protein